MTIRWVQACIALNERDEAVGVLYMGNKAKSFPSKQMAEQVTQTLKMMPPLIEQVRHPPSREKVRKAYRN